ncbi:MAG TPA: thiamine phosphate synthase [Polyangia bacterium]|nr:thiamine phosphate synthase [Polyangia bacterium]
MASSSSGERPAFDARLLLITDGFDASTLKRVRDAIDTLPRGLAAVQLRAKRLEGAALHAAAVALRPVAPILLINDRADVALAAGADGVHLPARGLPVAVARAFGGGRLLVGASTHLLAEGVAAKRDGADYVVFGPVWPTGAKEDAIGVDALAEAVRACAPMPVFALGGVDAERARAAVAVGARVACIGAVLGRSDAGAAARALALAIG